MGRGAALVLRAWGGCMVPVGGLPLSGCHLEAAELAWITSDVVAAAAPLRSEISEVEQPRRLGFVLGDGRAPHIMRGVCRYSELVCQQHDDGLERRLATREVHAAEWLLGSKCRRLAQAAMNMEVAGRRPRRCGTRAGVVRPEDP